MYMFDSLNWPLFFAVTHVQVMVHTEFNDDIERFPYNRNDNADIDEVLTVRVTELVTFDCGFCLSEIFNTAAK